MSFSNFAIIALLALTTALPAAAEIRLFDGTSFADSLSTLSVPAPARPAVTGAQAAAAAPLPQKDYTIMLFMNGRNNLGAMMVRKLVELEQLGSDANINIAMQLGIMKLKPTCVGQSCAYPYGADWEGVRRYFVRKTTGAGRGIEASVRMKDPQNQDMGDYKALVDFVGWAKRLMPAKHYILVIGNHGGAWVDKPKTPKPSSSKGVSYDDVTGNYITTPEIGLALREMGGADILIFDDCLMQTAEVAAEVGASAQFIAGSEEISYTNHFKPALLFAPLKKTPAMLPASFMSQYAGLSEAYLGKLWQTTGKYPGTTSILQTSELGGFQDLVRQYAAAAKDLVETSPAAKAAYTAAMKDALRYHYKYCADFYDFLRLAQQQVAASAAAGTDKAQAVDVLAEKIKNHITLQLTPYNFAVGTAEGKDYTHSKGVSVYVPYLKDGVPDGTPPVFMIASPRLQTKYEDLAFAKATGWDLFVKALTKK